MPAHDPNLQAWNGTEITFPPSLKIVWLSIHQLRHILCQSFVQSDDKTWLHIDTANYIHFSMGNEAIKFELFMPSILEMCAWKDRLKKCSM